MANTTVRGAVSIHGSNPQFLVEKVIRSRIWESTYWKEHCFALTAESIIDKAIELHSIGGTYANTRPSPFQCLLLKLLQIQPEKEILVEYLQAEEFKYLRALAAMYIRMTFRSVEVYELLEPLLNDYRKLRFRSQGGYYLTYMDEFIDSLLNEERVCDLILPRLTKRDVLEDTEGLRPRKSKLADVMMLDEESDAESASGSEAGRGRKRRKKSLGLGTNGDRTDGLDGPPSSSSSRSRSASRSVSSGGYVSRSPSRSRSRSPSVASSAEGGGRGRYVSRSPSRSSLSRSRSPSPSLPRPDSPHRDRGSETDGGDGERKQTRTREERPGSKDRSGRSPSPASSFVSRSPSRSLDRRSTTSAT